MSTRYRLVPFDNERDPVKVLEDVLLKSMPKDTWGGAGICDIRVEPAVCALVHFRRQGCKALLVQSGITDPDFLDEHAAFYAKQHRDVVRKCVRVHAFTLESVDESDEDARVIDFLDRSQSVSSSYLGFITLRPLRHARIGASILKPGLPGVTARDDFPVHIAGNTFCVNGTPFLQQDSAVGACAQASICKRLGNTG